MSLYQDMTEWTGKAVVVPPTVNLDSSEILQKIGQAKQLSWVTTYFYYIFPGRLTSVLLLDYLTIIMQGITIPPGLNLTHLNNNSRYI